MPSRIIREGILTSERVNMLSERAELFYRRLMSVVDDYGRYTANLTLLRASCYPLKLDSVKEDSIKKHLAEAEGAGLIVLYTVAGKAYLEMQDFNQRIQSKSKFPAPSEADGNLPKEPVTQQDETDTDHDSTVIHGESPEETALVGDEVEVEVGTAMPPTSALQCPTQRIVELYHDLMPDNPRVRVLDDSRRKTISSRWKEAARLKAKPFGYSSPAEGLEAWRTFFEICNESEFLTGKAPPGFGRDKPFIADLDFLMSPKGFKGCLENKYHRDIA